MVSKTSEDRFQALVAMLRESHRYRNLVIFVASVSSCDAVRRGSSVQAVAEHLVSCDLDKRFLRILADPEHDDSGCYSGEEFSGGLELARAIMLGEGLAFPKELLDLHPAYQPWLTWYTERDAKAGMSARLVGRLSVNRPKRRS